jgi:ribonuclease P protein component
MLAKARRVRSQADFDLVGNARAKHSAHLSVRWGPVEGATRVGVTVGKRVSAKATVRNRTKRRLRATLAELYTELVPGQLIVIGAKPGSDALDYAALQAELTGLLKTATLLS